MEDQEQREADEGDELEAAIMETDRAFGAESVGTTAEEGRAGESLGAPGPLEQLLRRRALGEQVPRVWRSFGEVEP